MTPETLKAKIDALQAEHGRSCGMRASQIQQKIDWHRKMLEEMLATQHRYPGLDGEPQVKFNAE